jgi:alkanesulfonate monooxygenase SsuD/methylene tetrahydromethanopterin reductase-like flavin-dependent oxidoreductase (luciferase family)
VELGLYTFGDITPDPHTGKSIGVPQRYAEILAAARLADEAGLDVFGIGEHHRMDMAISSPAVVMAAIGGMTKRIRLASAVTILSTLDPVRVFEDFATVDLTSNGRAEIIAGRGAFTESFSMFGYDFADYDPLFAEHLELLLQLGKSQRITWSGRFRPPLDNAQISPRPLNGAVPVWVGVGGTLASAERAGRLGLPLSLANISQPPAKLAPQVEAYRARGGEAGHDPKALRVAVAGHLHVDKDSRQARERFYPHLAAYFRSHAPDSSYSPDVSRETFDARAAPTGSLLVGSPQEIIDKVLYERRLFGHDRYLAQIDLGGMPYAEVARMIELLAVDVLPVLRREA